MLRKVVLSSICAFSLMAYEGDTEGAPECGCGPHPVRLTMRHIESRGIGYNQGYTTLEGFATPSEPWGDHWIPFADLRGHFFNDGRFATNVGVGLRYLTSRIWGVSGYYDYRKTSRQHYNQAGIGLESLGEIWDFRINGYLPFGKDTSPSYGRRFHRFKEHHMIVSYKREFALKGINAEAGLHVNCFKRVPLYFAAGPYYLNGHGKTAWGGEARATVELGKYIRLEGNTSYDTLFKWIGQGQLSLQMPLGPRHKVKASKKRSCSTEMLLRKRSVQRVDRNEIIPVDKKRKDAIAINPMTREPYFFWFVDNTSHSQGTFESPFNTLVDAQNASSTHDVIYIFPGDGTTTGMDQGLILKDSQKLFGAGISQAVITTHGTITIPPQASGMPKITGNTDRVITCANENEISGLYVSAPIMFGVVCTDITSSWIHNNIFAVTSNGGSDAPGTGIRLSNCGGTFTIDSNQFILGQFFPWAIHLISTAPQATYLISNNIFQELPTTLPGRSSALELGARIDNPLGDFGSIQMTKNQFIGHTNKTIGGSGFGGVGQFILDQNIFSKCDAGNVTANTGHVFLRIQSGGDMNMQITNNIFENSVDLTQRSINIQTLVDTAKVCVVLDGNITDATPNAYVLNNTEGGSFRAQIGQNIGPIQEFGPITPGLCP